MKSQIEIRASIEGEITLQQFERIHHQLEAEIHRFLVSVITNKQVKGKPCYAIHVESPSIPTAGLLATPIA